MKKIFPLLLLMTMPLGLFAQFNLGERVRSKVNQRVNQKVDKVIDEVLDSAEGKKKQKDAPEQEATTAEEENTIAKPESKKERLSSYSKFDFVPGEKVCALLSIFLIIPMALVGAAA